MIGLIEWKRILRLHSKHQAAQQSVLRNLPITNTGLGCIKGPNPVQIIESTQKAAKFGLSRNPKQGVLHPGDAFYFELPLFKPGQASIDSQVWPPAFSYT